jgi:hypothetical protein|tara:strand:- start:332 stop:721 length:390 start_codon:yes stop_codon:yes gene_type:complete
VYKKILSKNLSWNFKDQVPKKFSYHIKKSIPLYSYMHNMNCELRDFFLKEKSVCYDLGSSTGLLLNKISDFFNHNHQRYFNGSSLELKMIKHGWIPFLTTQYPIYGPTRLPGCSAYGRFSSKKPNIKSF